MEPVKGFVYFWPIKTDDDRVADGDDRRDSLTDFLHNEIESLGIGSNVFFDIWYIFALEILFSHMTVHAGGRRVDGDGFRSLVACFHKPIISLKL